MTGLDFHPFDGSPPVPKMGLERLAMEDWILIDEDPREELELRADLIERRRDEVLRLLPGGEELALELHEILADHLERHHPGHLVRSAGGTRMLTPTGRTFRAPVDGLEALVQVGHWVQEDFCLLGPEAPQPLLAACVCFPSRWSLAEKVGCDSDAIHEPVPGFAARLALPTRRYLEMLTPESPTWRVNWTLHDSTELFSPPGEPLRTDLEPATVLEEVVLRLERQTLVRLPRTRAVAFSIRTHRRPLREVLPDARSRELALRTLLALEPATIRYKNLGNLLPVLLEALAHDF